MNPRSRPTQMDPSQPRHVQVAGQELVVFPELSSFLAGLLADIQAARRRIWIESYIFYHDAAGRAVAEALRERALAGVEVKVLYDALGSQTTPAAFFQEMEAAGVQVHAFHSIWEAFWRFSFLRVLNRRNHRKIIVIDNDTAYFGGMNLIDPSRVAGLPAEAGRPTSAGWRDVQVRLTGPQQAEIAESFDRSWRRAHRQKVERRSLDYRLAVLSEKPESIQFFDTGPGLRYTRAARVFTRLIRRAQRGITLSMAYFIPVGRVLRELLRARRRGVRVQIILPGESDVQLAQWAARYLYTTLLRRRIAIHESSAEMLHSKVMVVDHEWTIVGSCNLDSRSLFTNLEFLAVIRSPTLGRTMLEVCRYEMERGRRVTLRDCYQRSLWQRLLNRMAWTLRWWL